MVRPLYEYGPAQHPGSCRRITCTVRLWCVSSFSCFPLSQIQHGHYSKDNSNHLNDDASDTVIPFLQALHLEPYDKTERL